ncbi:MAG TPA: hypothetical protein VMZ31_18510 [Phycisphaerae bacterium]|nr:hypothetical protein [Phycisphaerae bacterium]
MRTTAQRIAKYNARMLSSLVDPVLSAVEALATANFTSYVNEFVPNQVALRVILNDEGVNVIDVVAYEAFHGEVYALSKKFSGPAAQAEFCILVAKWADASHLGAAAQAILERIGLDIYTYTGCGTL